MLDLTAVIWAIGLLSTLCICLNSFCIHVIRTSTKFHEKPSALLIINLLATHLFQAIVVFPLYAGKKLNQNKEWKEFFSSGFLFAYMVSFYGACYGILNISLDRFLATYLLTRYKIYATYHNVTRVISVSWVLVILLCSIPFMPLIPSNHSGESVGLSSQGVNSTSQAITNSEPMDESKIIDSVLTDDNSFYFIDVPDELSPSERRELGFHRLADTNIDNARSKRRYVFENIPRDGVKNITVNPYTSRPSPPIIGVFPRETSSRDRPRDRHVYTPQKQWTVFMLFFNAAFPLGVIIICYVYILFRLKQLNRLDLQNKKEKDFDKYKQVTSLTLILAVTYTLCWGPSIVYYTILSVCEHACFGLQWDNSFTEKHVVFVIKFLAFMNAMFSPLIYCFHQTPEVHRSVAKLRNFFTFSRKGPRIGGVGNCNVVLKSADLGDITVTVNQTFNTTGTSLDASRSSSTSNIPSET